MRILIVDDEPHITRALTILFEKTGYEVSSAYNGADGLAKLHTERPDVAIVDVMMPGVSGLELLRAWQDQRPEAAGTRFLVLTASCDERIAACVHDFENVQLIPKPFSPHRILRLVQDLATPNPAPPQPVLADV
jgi:DNA-binding response OmpR family regulator